MVDRSSRIKLSAGQIFWHEAGDSRRPVLIFLHGSWHDRTQWDGAINLLSKNFHCLALDLLGFGNSIAVQAPNSIEMEVDCLQEFITALKLRQIYLIGHSLGAWIAVSYALKYPKLVKGIVTISPEGFSVANWQYQFTTRWLLSQPSMFRLWLNSLQVIASIGDGVEPLTKSLAYWGFFKRFPTTCKLLFQRSERDIRRELVADKLAQFKLPLLILQSDRAERQTIEQSQSYARSVRTSEYKLIKEPALTSPPESIRQMAVEIQDFLDRLQLHSDREELETW
ncbi:alpha/beta hydrolase [Chamaesiphon sp. OTE_8_metabat_110]|uniref:alpha/beta fold hydrolase n=1 Tax=Chamaesiphon sp. OTE_8_metabat_110 TaxID=2964696 RepID=UPI00286A0C05|nr:alpha/beta hydrolase [Chamaesiphon sp. OTE_8_metabat_110]